MLSYYFNLDNECIFFTYLAPYRVEWKQLWIELAVTVNSVTLGVYVTQNHHYLWLVDHNNNNQSYYSRLININFIVCIRFVYLI